MANVIIDGTEYDLPAGKNLLEAVLGAGIDLPYFCWHPALGSVGACRQCAVKQYRDENDQRGMLVMSCMVPVTDGARFSIEEEDVTKFRETVTEWLMTNHPHDCPVCDEGGHCHLQDMTVMTGHNYRSYRFTKRTYRNQQLGPHINHEMNRCITCYRCVRFYDDYAGGKDLQAMASHNHVYFGRHEDGTLDSEFSGNLIEVCPTGVFTDKTFKQHFIRKWDLQAAPSICQGCSLGCNIIAHERYGKMRLVWNRYHHDLNGYFICDRGRFGYEYVNSDQRMEVPQLNGETVDETQLSEWLTTNLAEGKRILGIGSPRASLESNFALRALAGDGNFSTGIGEDEASLLQRVVDIRREHPANNPTLKDIEESDVVLILGEDVTQTAPRMALGLRQAVRNQPMADAAGFRIPEWSDKAMRLATYGQSGPLFSATPRATRLDDVATATRHGAPLDLARLGYAIAHALDADAPAVADLSEAETTFVQQAAEALKAGKKPAVIAGTSLNEPKLIEAAANVALALEKAEIKTHLAYILPEANSMGLTLMGGMNLQEAMEQVQSGDVDTLVVLENNLFHKLPASQAEMLLDDNVNIICIDHSNTPTSAKADCILPAGTFAEADGTLVNFEGRAQRFFQVYPAPGAIQEGWRWVRDLMEFAGHIAANEWQSLDDILLAIEEDLPALKGVANAAPLATFRNVGGKIPRLSRRASGRTAMEAHIEVSEDQPEDDPDSPMSFSMEGSAAPPPPALINRYYAPGWSSVSSLNRFQDEIGGPLRGGDPGARILPAPAKPAASFYNHVPQAFQNQDGEVLIMPLHHVFGSEEWSATCPGIQQRSPGPYLALSTDDAEQAGLADGDLAQITVSGKALTLPVQVTPSLAQGTAGLPANFKGLEGLNLPVTSALPAKS